MPYTSDLTGGETIFADSVTFGAAANAIDNNTSTIWSTGSSAFPHWITIDFGESSLTDVTGSGTASADSETFGAASNAFDNNTGTIWSTSSSSFPHYLKYDFGSGDQKIIRSYAITCRSDSQEGDAPKDWILQGSNNDSDWDDLDTITGVLFRLGQTNYFDINNETSYRYYRVLVSATANNSSSGLCQIAELQLSEVALTTTNRQRIRQYTLTCRTDTQQGDAPEDFTLQASNDNSNWTTLDTQTSQAFSLGETKTYNGFTNDNYYRFYRVHVTATANNSSSGLCQLAELEMMDFIFDEFQISEDISINEGSLLLSTYFVANENITFNDNINLVGNIDASFATKIISINPLVFVTNTDPAEIVKVDISDPENPVSEVKALLGASNALDVVYNSNSGFVYVACANGIVVKVDIDNLDTQEIIDLDDSDDIETIGVLSDLGLAYASTNQTTGEIYLIDEREVTLLNTDLHLIIDNIVIVPTILNIINAETLNTDLQILSQQTTILRTDLKILLQEDEAPINQLDIKVYLDDIELYEKDVNLKSITITHTIDQEFSTATLRLSRRHDNLDVDVLGNNRPITAQNDLRIEINGITEFDGNVSNLNCIYDRSNDVVEVTGTMNQKTPNYKKVNLSLAGLDEDTNLYQVYIQNPNISNPVLAANATNPQYFKGIRVNLGDIVKQSVTRFNSFQNGSELADQIINGNLSGGHPKQNWTYFWFLRAGLIRPSISQVSTSETTTVQNSFLSSSNFPTNQFPDFNFNSFSGQFSDFVTTLSIQRYVGTSLSGISSDFWQLISASYKYQRIFPDIIDPGIITDNFKSTGGSTFLLTETPTNGFHSIEEVNVNGKPLDRDEYTFSGNSVTISAATKSGDRVQIVYGVKDYFLGSAPFQTITTQNGKFVPKERWEDGPDGFYKVKDDEYDYINFAKEVAALEYEKLKNINGQVLPRTSCTLTVSLDAYYYYGISLLTRINVDNTIKKNIFKDSNGFPVSVKSITITSSERTLNASLICDNNKSNQELDKINGRFPDENSEDYFKEGYSIKEFSKFDLVQKVDTE